MALFSRSFCTFCFFLVFSFDYPLKQSRVFIILRVLKGKQVSHLLNKRKKRKYQMKILYLVRGLPGSGKTTLAKVIQPKKLFCCCADDYFTDPEGRYKFDPDQIHLAHEYCRSSVESRMKENEYCSSSEPIVVHNTLSQPWEACAYRRLAEKYGYEVFIVECQNNFGSVHGVPQQAIDNMKSRWLSL